MKRTGKSSEEIDEELQMNLDKLCAKWKELQQIGSMLVPAFHLTFSNFGRFKVWKNSSSYRVKKRR